MENIVKEMNMVQSTIDSHCEKLKSSKNLVQVAVLQSRIKALKKKQNMLSNKVTLYDHEA